MVSGMMAPCHPVDLLQGAPTGSIADDALSSGSLVAGGSTQGQVCFDAKSAPGEYRVIYSSALGGAQASWTTAVK